MSTMEDWRSKKAWIGVLLVAAIAWMVSHILDLFTTAAIGVWGNLLALISLGSVRVRDLPYSTAAMNPYPLPPLILFGAYCVLPLLPLCVLVGRALGRRTGAKWKARMAAVLAENPSAETTEKIRQMEVARRRKLFCLVTIPGLFVAVYSLIPLGVINQAVLIRRVYEADRDIVAPYLSTDQRVQLQADFCVIETKAQFGALMNRIKAVASAHHVKLRSEYDD
jgi:hypothetical protein